MKHSENIFSRSLQQSVTLLCGVLSLTITNPLLQEAREGEKKKNAARGLTTEIGMFFFPLKIKEW